MNLIITTWKDSLRSLVIFYETKRGKSITFYLKLFLFFFLLNITCYWIAMFTAFPEYTQGKAGVHYFKIQFPVGFLGALFDSLSFFVTVYIIRQALRTRNGFEYLAHLSLDAVISVAATFWVLFVFSSSGWLISFIESTQQTLTSRNERYEKMLAEAVASPAENWRNIYFGMIMGVSAILPTCGHVYLFFRSALRVIARQTQRNNFRYQPLSAKDITNG